jgi:hypothetical protein
MQVMRLLISHQIDHKTAGLLLYALQTASFNLRRTDFEPVVKTKIVIDPTRVDETALGQSQWQNEDFETPEETNEEEEAEEAENGHLEIQAMAAPNPRSDRRPRLSRRGSAEAWEGHDFRSRQEFVSMACGKNAREGHDFSRAVRSLKSSALAAGGCVAPARMLNPQDSRKPGP